MLNGTDAKTRAGTTPWFVASIVVPCLLIPLVATAQDTSAAAEPTVASAATSQSRASLFGSDATPSLTDRRRADFGAERPSSAARQIANWVVHSGDHGELPFLIVDKRYARVYAFDPTGRVRGAAAVLLGLARGDDSVPGIGDRKLSEIRPQERTTPAGRFVAEWGRNTRGEDIVWIDYDAAVSMHRVRANNSLERRLQRLSSPTPSDNRISYGCINVPAQFYDAVLAPTFARSNAVVYVLPEVKSAREVFNSYDVDGGMDQASAGRATTSGLSAARTIGAGPNLNPRR